MIPPGGSWTYKFDPDTPGILYYHCHSADGGHHITEHIHQGLYGAIIVKDPNAPPVRDEVIFMSEIGFDTEGDSIPPFIMNGLGLPGGEHALEEAYASGGFDAVAAQFNKTVPVIEAKVGEETHVHVINIGDQVHSFHAHNVKHISLGTLQGDQWAGNVLPLVPGQADTLQFTFTKPGPWLFHCHVVAHADAGMIGLFNITEAEPTEQ
jgi:FtsP/CotA-like multicopper oxidase with cupredoxin domain